MFDTKAFNEGNIDFMKGAIDDYTKSVEKHLDDIREEYNFDKAGLYGSDQIATVKKYIDATANEINSIVRYFDDFNKALDDVQKAYQTQQGQIHTDEVTTADAGDRNELVNVKTFDS